MTDKKAKISVKIGRPTVTSNAATEVKSATAVTDQQQTNINYFQPRINM